MKIGVKRFKQSVSVVLSFLMVFLTIFCAKVDFSFAEEGGKVYSVSLGAPKLSSGTEFSNNSEFCFDSATITGNGNITSMTISVNKGGISKNTCGTFSDLEKNGKHKTSTWVWGNGKTPSEVQAELRSVKFLYEEDMEVTVTVDGNRMSLPNVDGITITSRVLENNLSSLAVDGTMHYYIFVPDTSKNNTWQKAYDIAKESYFMGMRGYLVTITEIGEDIVLDNITTVGAWAGGARLLNTTTLFDCETGNSYAKPTTTAGTCWYWVDGPEKGMKIPNNGSTDASKKNVDEIAPGDFGATSYSNWRRKKNDANNQEPNNYTSNNKPDCEWCLQVHYPENEANSQHYSDGAKLGWNDLNPDVINLGYNKDAMKGFFIEFSDYVGGTDASFSRDNVTTVTKQVNHTHSLTFSFTDSEDDSQDKITVKCSDPRCNFEYSVNGCAQDDVYSGNAYSLEKFNSVTDGITNNSEITNVFVKYQYEGKEGTSYSLSEIPPVDSGDYQLIVSLVDSQGNVYRDTNNNPVTMKSSFTIRKLPITLKPASQQVKVSKNIVSSVEKMTPFSGTNSLANGETLTAISLIVTGTDSTLVSSVSQNSISVVSGSAVIMKGTKDTTSNYSFTYETGLLNVSKNDVSVISEPTLSAITYGEKVKDSTINGGTVKDIDGNVIPGTWSFEASDKEEKPSVSDSDSTEYTLVFTPADSEKYNTKTIEKTITVNPKEISVDWNGGNVTYDGEKHIPVPTAVGVLSGDTVNLTVSVKQGETFVDTSLGPVNAGNYTAKATSGNPNYVISQTQGSKDYSIEKRPVELTAPGGNAEIGKAPTETLDYTKIRVTNGSFALGDKISSGVINYSTENLGATDVTIYAVTIRNGNGNGSLVTDNYEITYKKGTLNVSKKILTIQDSNKPIVTITYGDKLGDTSSKNQLVTRGTIVEGGNEITGHWEWDEEEQNDIENVLPHVSDTNKTYPVKFVPDSDDYAVVKTTIDITVNPKPIDLDWDRDSFEYNGHNQRPTATAKASQVVNNDSVSFTYVGQEKDVTPVGLHYETTATSSNPDYVVKDTSKTKNYVITPKAIDPNDNSVIEIDITYDVSGNIEVTVTDKEIDETLSENTDYTVDVDCNPDDEFWDVVIDFEGNYSGQVTKTVKNMLYSGSVVSILDVDSVGREINPRMEAVEENKAIALIIKKLNNASVALDKKTQALDIIDRIMNASDHQIEDGEYEAVVTLSIKDADSSASQQDRDEIRNLINNTDELNGMQVGKYLDLSLSVQYKVNSVDSNGIPSNLVLIRERVTDTSSQYLGSDAFDETVTITVPTSLRPATGHMRTYSVARVHYNDNGTVITEELPVTRNGYELTFHTNKFSTYALLYKDTLINPGPTVNPSPAGTNTPSGQGLSAPTGANTASNTGVKVLAVQSPKTGDTSDVFFGGLMILLGISLLVVSCFAKRKIRRISK